MFYSMMATFCLLLNSFAFPFSGFFFRILFCCLSIFSLFLFILFLFSHCSLFHFVFSFSHHRHYWFRFPYYSVLFSVFYSSFTTVFDCFLYLFPILSDRRLSSSHSISLTYQFVALLTTIWLSISTPSWTPHTDAESQISILLLFFLLAIDLSDC